MCGALLVREALTGGFRDADAPEGAEHGHWRGFVWVSVGLLANAALITTIGFILSCRLCFVFAVQGFKMPKASGARVARVARQRGSRLRDRGPCLLDVHAVAGDQSAGADRNGWL